MLKLGMIGACGHYSMAISGAVAHGGGVFTALAPGYPGEDMTAAGNALTAAGFSPTYYEDSHALLTRGRPDVVVVDNRYGEHAPVIQAALEAGCPVFTDKPAAASLRQLDELREVWQRSGLLCVSMLNYRCQGAFYGLKALIDTGALGEVRLIQTQKSYRMGVRPGFVSDRSAYGGTIPWVGIHAADWIRWYACRPFVSVSALSSAACNHGNGSMEATAMALFSLTGGVMAQISMDLLNPETSPEWGDDRVRVVGTRGVAEVRAHTLTLLHADTPGIQTIPVSPDRELFAGFLDEVQGHGRCDVSGEDSFAACEAVLRARQAADTGRIVCF